MIGRGALGDPFRLTQIKAPAYTNTAGKTVADSRVRTPTLICVGQSNITNVIETLYTPTQNVLNLNVFDGGLYKAVDPLLGCTSEGGNWLGRLGDKLIAGGGFCDRVVLVPIGVTSTSIADWAPGGALNNHILTAVGRCIALGLEITAFLWQQGETDNLNGMSQAAYASHLSGVIDTPRNKGCYAPWFVGKSTYFQGATSSAIRAACDSVVNGTDIFAGADTDTLGASYRHADNVHLSANGPNGANAAAELWKAALGNAFWA